MLNVKQIGFDKMGFKGFKIGFLASLVVLSVLFTAASCGGKSIEPNTDATEETTSTGGGAASKFRTGLFKYADAATFGDFHINRTKDSQVDSGIVTQLVVKFNLEWEDDTTYTLKYHQIINNPQSIQLPDLAGMYRNCIMTEITDTSYIEVSTSSLNKDTLRTMIVRVK